MERLDDLNREIDVLSGLTSVETREEEEGERLEASLEAKRRYQKAEQAEALEALKALAAKVAAIPKKHLDELRQLPNPPLPVVQTLQAVHGLLEASGDRGGARQGGGGGGGGGGGAIAMAAKRLGAGVAISASETKSRFKSAAQKATAGARVAPHAAASEPARLRALPPPAKAPTPPLLSAPTTLRWQRRHRRRRRQHHRHWHRNGGDGGIALASWELVRGRMADRYVQRVKAFDAAKVSADACACVASALPSGPDALSQVGRASVACAPLFEWARASLDLASSLQAAAPAKLAMAQLEAQLAQIREQRADARARAGGRLEQNRRLQVEAETLRLEVLLAEAVHELAVEVEAAVAAEEEEARAAAAAAGNEGRGGRGDLKGRR